MSPTLKRQSLALSAIMLVFFLCGFGPYLMDHRKPDLKDSRGPDSKNLKVFLGQPDLKVSLFSVGKVKCDIKEGRYLLPTCIKVKNVGAVPCNESSVYLEFSYGPDKPAIYYFTVPGKFENKIKWQCKALDVNEEEIWIGTIWIMRGSQLPSVILLEVTADSDNKIIENKETNNKSSVNVTLPNWNGPDCQ